LTQLDIAHAQAKLQTAGGEELFTRIKAGDDAAE
jgi:hypothetical protein